MSDWADAQRAGRFLLAGHLDVFARMPEVQMGPLSLTLAGLLSGPMYMLSVCAMLPLLLWLISMPFPAGRGTYGRLLFGGMLISWPWAAYAVQGHGDDAIVILGVVAMVTSMHCQRNLGVVAGFLLAIAAKPTAILFLPLAFLTNRRARVLATMGGGVIWAPFVLADPSGFLAAGSGKGDLWPNSLIDFVGGHPHTGFPVWVRPVQLVGGLALCWVLARRNGAAAAVAGVLAFRVLLEPGTWNYYSTAIIVAGLMLDLQRGHRLPWVALLGFVSFAAQIGDPPISLAPGIVRLLALAGVLAFATRWHPEPISAAARSATGATSVEDAPQHQSCQTIPRSPPLADPHSAVSRAS